MSQDIQGIGAQVASQVSNATKPADSDARDIERQRSLSRDQVTITDTASRLRAQEEALTSEPVVDVQRVEEIRSSIAEGRFAVNPTRTADKIFQLETMLEAKQGGGNQG